MKNPYVRLRELCGMSQKAFAAKHGFGKMTMVYLEAGMYTAVSDRQNQALGKECYEKGVDAKTVLVEEFKAHSLDQAYQQWRVGERREHAPTVLAKVSPPFVGDSELSPVACLVRDTTGSLQGFCKVLKVPSITVSRYIRGETKSMPVELQAAFADAGWPFVGELDTAQAKWWVR
jgi:hypothetical protein